MKKLLAIALALGCAFIVSAQTQVDRLQLDQNAAITQNYQAGGTITEGHLLKLNSSGQVIETTTSDTTGVIGVSETTTGIGNNVLVVIGPGQAPVATDGPCAIGNYLTISVTINGVAACGTSPPTNQIIGRALTAIFSAGVVPQASIQIGSGGGGGGGALPFGNNGDIQTKASGTTFGSAHINDGGTFPNTLAFTENSCFEGPRPYIDVTCYGALGDGGAETATGAITISTNTLTVSSVTGTFQVGMYIHVNGAGASGDVLLAKITNISGSTYTLSVNAGTTVSGASVKDDDTLPIQAAMTAFCAQSGAAGGGSIYFPPGNYLFSQPQSSNPNAIPFVPGCQGMHFLGAEEKAETGTAQYTAPQVSLIPNCGSAPNAQAAFLLAFPHGNQMAFDNLVINGCNKAMQVGGANVVHLRNTWLTGGGSGADACALQITDSFWFWMEGGGLQSPSTSIPSLLMTGDSGGSFIGTGNIYISNILLEGGPVKYIQRANISTAPSGHWVFRNWTWENGNGDLIQVSNTGSFNLGSLGPITLDDVQISDNGAASPALINFNPGVNVPLSGVNITSSFGGNTNWPAIKVQSGTIDSYSIKGCRVQCSSLVVNSSGAPIGNGILFNTGGFDSLQDTTDVERLINAPVGNANINGKGTGVRLTPSGSSFSSVGMDPVNGLMFANPSQAGYNAQIYQNTSPNIDIAFAANYAPTGVAATPSNIGGSLAGTFWVYVVSTLGTDCTTYGNYSAPSAILGPYTITGTSGSIALTWTPAVTGLTAINGYCVVVDSRGQYNVFDSVSALVSGAGATGATITSFPNMPVGPEPVTRQMVAVNHFTPFYSQFNRTIPGGTSLSGSDFTLSSAWGSSASKTVIGTDQVFQITITSAGTGQVLDPTFTLTYHDGLWPSAPIYVCHQTGGTGTRADIDSSGASTSSLTAIWDSTPTAGLTYIIACRAN